MTHTPNSDLVIVGGRIVRPGGSVVGDVLVQNGRITAVGERLVLSGVRSYDARGKLVFPGVIDPQVHFREPGLEHKEDLASGTLAAIAGGVTSIMEMPNTRPPTVLPEALADKLSRAEGRAHSDHAFFLGASPANADQLGEWETARGCAGIKIFMGSSTGSLLVEDDPTIERVLRSGSRRVAVHSEDNARLTERYADVVPGSPHTIHPDVRDVETAVRATKRLLDLVEKTGRKIHLLHVSTAEEIALLRERDLGDLVTSETTPNHLFLCAPDCYERWGGLVQMNPPVRDRRHQSALREALADGTLTCIGSDHAPHTLEEKAQPYPKSPSGIPGVQTILPLLLTAVRDGWLTLEDVPRIVSQGPSQAYGMTGKGDIAVGQDADIVLVDPDERGPLRLEQLHSRAGYSPYVGMRLHGYPIMTMLRGRVAYENGAPVGDPSGAPLRFDGAV